MKKLISIMLTVCMLFAAMPMMAATTDAVIPTRLVNNGVLEIDDDGSDGYSGDYVVIYNPSTSAYNSVPTGDMSGLIETEINAGSNAAAIVGNVSNEPQKLHVEPIVDKNAAAPQKDGYQAESEPLSFEVGDTYNFQLNSTYNPLSTSSVEFKVLAKGEHCYIWTPTTAESNVYPLDEIDESFAEICAAEFDSKFDLMQSSFGDHTNGAMGDGRLNILYYNINCGWDPSTGKTGYVAGFFSNVDISTNGMPCLNIDTYPGVYYVDSDGEEVCSVNSTFNTMVHEYQHLINYSECGYSDTWINESMSAAAEEICYPGSSIAPRIQQWLNYYFNTNQDWLNPPAEHEYNPEWELHNGFSMYNWSEFIEVEDRLALYAQVSLYAQYIYTRYGNTTFRSILEHLAAWESYPEAFENVTGQSASEFARDFRIALVANDPTSYNGIYGFEMQQGYNPDSYYGVENLYNWLAPVVFTGSSCNIFGGGAITIKPADGVYHPPADANSTLEYYGVTLDTSLAEPVPLTNISLNPEQISLYAGTTKHISTVREPQNANRYELTWVSSNPDVAVVAGNNKTANVTGISAGTATIMVTAHDTINDLYYTAATQVTVLGMPTVDDALNIENGTLQFNNHVGTQGWQVDLASDADRISVRSSNQGIGGSDAIFTLSVPMNAGDTMSFDWKVSSESGYDSLLFRVNNIRVEVISGDVDWTTIEYTAQTTGTYYFEWKYSKDSSFDRGSDCGWVDNVYVPGYVSSTPTYEQGDVDMDGMITVMDALVAMRTAMGVVEASDQQLEISDMDGDGSITSIDALLIMRAAIDLN